VCRERGYEVERAPLNGTAERMLLATFRVAGWSRRKRGQQNGDLVRTLPVDLGSPTTTGKTERWHKTLRAEFLRGYRLGECPTTVYLVIRATGGRDPRRYEPAG
jgi:hypothetical protein